MARTDGPAWFASEVSAAERQIGGHGCGVVFLKPNEHHVRAEQDDCEQAIYKIGEPPRLVITHVPGSCLGKPTTQLFVALESSASTPATQALANE